MKVLITNNTLDARAGTEMFVHDLALGLRSRGHEVACFTPRPGVVADILRAAVIPVVNDPQDCPFVPDIIHGQHMSAAPAALFAFPQTPAIFVCHGVTPWPETPLVKFDQIRRFVAVDMASAQRLADDLDLPVKTVKIIANGVDLTRFRPAPDNAARRKRALVYSNQPQDARVPVLQSACAANGIELDIRGAAVGAPVDNPENVLTDYGLVFAKARAAMEAMACGCNVILCDYGKWGPAVTVENFHELATRNFGLTAITRELDADAIATEIRELDWDQVKMLPDMIAEHRSLDAMVDGFEGLYANVLQQDCRSGNNRPELAQFLLRLSPLMRERDALATRLYTETAQRLARDNKSAELLVRALVSLADHEDRQLKTEMARQILHLQPGHPIASEILKELER